jgi:ribokinase
VTPVDPGARRGAVKRADGREADGPVAHAVVIFGSVNVDETLSVDHFPRASETIGHVSSIRGLGGKGANQAVAAARAGAPVLLLAILGDDDDGDFAAQELIRLEVDLSRVERTRSSPTGRAIVVVEQTGSNIIFVRLAAAAGVRVVLNLAPFFAIDSSVADPLVMNEVEAGQLGRPLGSVTDVLDASMELLARARTVIVTLGAEGAVVLTPSLAEHISAPPSTAPVVDTTGAGDAFVGVLSAYLGSGVEIVDRRWPP